MKNAIPVLILFPVLHCQGQDTARQVFFSEVGWRLTVNPSKFADTSLFNSVAQKANGAINNTFGTDVDLLKQIHPLFTIIDGNYNIFGSTINLFDSSLFRSWELSYEASKQMILNVLENQAPAVQILDTLSGQEIVDGLKFERFYLKTFYPGQKLTMNTYWFYRKQNQYDFSVNISYTDPQKGQMFLDVFRKSRFIK